MSKTFRQFGVGVTVLDYEDLPGDMNDDDIVNEMCDVVQKAIDEWYASRGHEFLACEPTVG